MAYDPIIIQLGFFSVCAAILAGAAATAFKETRALWIEQEKKSPLNIPENPALHRGQSPVEIQEVDFLRAVRHFIQTHEFQLRPSAPKVLHDSWWYVADENVDEPSITLELKYEDAEQPFELRVKLDLLDGRPFGEQHNILRYGWSCHPSLSPSAEQIISYSIDELRLELLAHARARNPNTAPVGLGSQLGVTIHGVNGTVAPAPKRSSEMKRAMIAPTASPIEAKAYWPSPQDYNEAMQNPAANFELQILRLGKPELTPLGLPRASSGAFASVYKLQCGARNYAIKCFLTLVHDQKDRYELISRTVLNDDLDYTVDFEFHPSEMLVHGKRYPILRMDWVTGEPLNFYVERNLDNKEVLQQLAHNFVAMMVSLRHNGIAHGDLQHGNILVTNEGIRLVDYDGMFVPGMEGWVSNEIGHRNYQHPKRGPRDFGPWLDNFSAWVIYISLRVLAIHPEIWQLGAAGDEALLFRQSDFTAPESSELIKALTNHQDEFVKRATEALVMTLHATPDQVPYLDPN